jgi:hypothetical protein
LPQESLKAPEIAPESGEWLTVSHILSLTNAQDFNGIRFYRALKNNGISGAQSAIDAVNELMNSTALDAPVRFYFLLNGS